MKNDGTAIIPEDEIKESYSIRWADYDMMYFMQKLKADKVVGEIEIQYDDYLLLFNIGCGSANGQLVAARLWKIYKTDAKYDIFSQIDCYRLYRGKEYVEIDKQTYDKLASMKFQQFDGACDMVWWECNEKVWPDKEADSDEKPKNEFLQTFESLYSDGRIRNMTLDYTDKGFDIQVNINKLGQKKPVYRQSSNAYWQSYSNSAQPTTINNVYNDAVEAVEKYGKEAKTDEKD